MSPLPAALDVGTEPLLVVLDFDGTLVPIAPTPDAIQVPDALPARIQALQERGDAVVIVTGRPASFVMERVEGVPVVGLHGLQWPGEPLPSRSPALDPVIERGKALSARFPGLLVEDKGLAVGLHVRQVAPGQHAEALRQVRELAQTTVADDPELNVLEGHEVVEIRPRAASKARALQRLARSHPGRRVLYVGDDTTDEEAFAALPADGLAVRVGPPSVPTRASHRVPDVPAVYALLDDLARR